MIRHDWAGFAGGRGMISGYEVFRGGAENGARGGRAPLGGLGAGLAFGVVLVAGDFGADVAVVAVAEGGDVHAEAVEEAELLVEVGGDFAVPAGDEGGVAAAEDGGEGVGKVFLPTLVDLGALAFDVLGVEEDFGGEFLAELPFGEAALAPVAEVLPADGAALELVLEEGLDLGEGVEPGEEGVAGLVVAEAAVELFAEGEGETGDFTGASGHNTNGER